MNDQKPKKILPWSQIKGENVIAYARENRNEGMSTMCYVHDATNCT